MSRRNHERKGMEFGFLPRFESLEERLLLTTVHGSEFFVYHNSVGESVRVSLHGADDDAIELFAYDDEFGGVVDLVGLMNGDLASQIIWPDGLIIADDASAQWVEYNETPVAGQSPRGSRTEIYAIYIASCSEDTILTISTLAANQPTGDGWTTDITQFSSANLPVLSFLTSVGGDLSYTEAPAGSGGVIIGSERDPYVDPGNPANDNPVRHSAVALTDDMAVGVPVTGVFPGGDLHAGISIAATEAYTLITALGAGGIGTDVQAVASIGTDAYVVDLSAYFGKIISDGSVGGLGSNVQATASDAAGNMFGVDSGNSAEIFAAGAALGTDVRAVAVDAAGNFYYVDEATHNFGSATIAGGGVVIGGLFDTGTPTWRYDDVQALDFNPIDGLLYGVGTVTDTAGVQVPPVPAGPYLMTINTGTGAV
ncbi:MAG: hypothetical protein KAV00_16205, partial [Phycisphaerae bacterium]|nr:hypothetical protein [Phycisphaerae bacterium]